jgi:hypothetical protein
MLVIIIRDVCRSVSVGVGLYPRRPMGFRAGWSKSLCTAQQLSCRSRDWPHAGPKARSGVAVLRKERAVVER